MTIDRAIEIFDPDCPIPVKPGELEPAMYMAANALRFLKIMQGVPTCNTCAFSVSCGYSPAWGAQVRYNCPHHVPLKKGDENHATD